MSWRSGHLRRPNGYGRMWVTRLSIRNNSHLVREVGYSRTKDGVRLDFWSTRPSPRGASTSMYLSVADAEVVVTALLKALEDARG